MATNARTNARAEMKARAAAFRATRTPEDIARSVLHVTGWKGNPDITAQTYRQNAADMRATAAKAAAHPSGKCRGYTQADALESAERAEHNAVVVPEAMRKLLAERAAA